MTGSNFKVWEGIYASFADAPESGPGHHGSIWRERSLQAAREALEKLAAAESLDYSLRQRNAVLPGLVATTLYEQAKVRILDFGGGLGTGFLVLEDAVPGMTDRVDYLVVEVESICSAGAELFAGRKGPDFQSELPANAPFDIVHAASVMQYIEDWRGVIKLLTAYGARYFSLADIYIGNFATYATLQNYYGSRIRHWFINAQEFIGEVERNGYQLILRSDCEMKVLGAHGPLPMDHFPSDLRVAHGSNLLFGKQAGLS
jgi:putative methyltransferase (TIGR04325 family)